MAKDPAFLFYTNDFLSGIQDLTFEERGQYITLLCLQHQKGHLTEKMIRLSCGIAAADVMAKFRQDSAGLWYNVRLDIEIEKRRAHGEKQSKRASEGWKQRKNKQETKPPTSRGIATAMPLEDENVNEDENEVIIKKEENPETSIFNQAFDEMTMDNYRMHFKNVDVLAELSDFKLKVTNAWSDYKNHEVTGLRNAFQFQLKNAKPLIPNQKKKSFDINTFKTN